MSETEVKQTKAKTTKTTTKRTTRKTTPKKQVTETAQMPTLTPELMAQFMQFLQQAQTPVSQSVETPAVSNKPMSRAELNKYVDDIVDVYSVVGGIVIYESPKTKMQYQWTSIGECVPMSIGELITMYSMKKAFLVKPWLRVDDQRVIQALGLEKSDELGKKLERIDEVLTLDLTEIRQFVESLNEFAKEELANQVATLISEEKLNNIHLIRELERLLEKELIL